MYRSHEYRRTEYHSFEWYMLCAQGWITMTIENGTATMIRAIDSRGQVIR
jgi:hypothetical protein